MHPPGSASVITAPYLCCSLSVVVEDVSSSCCVTVKVFPYMTVAALKQQVKPYHHYGFKTFAVTSATALTLLFFHRCFLSMVSTLVSSAG